MPWLKLEDWPAKALEMQTVCRSDHWMILYTANAIVLRHQARSMSSVSVNGHPSIRIDIVGEEKGGEKERNAIDNDAPSIISTVICT